MMSALLIKAGGRSTADASDKKLMTRSAAAGSINCRRAAVFNACSSASWCGGEEACSGCAAVMTLHIMVDTFDARGSRVERRVEATRSRKMRAEWRSWAKLFLDASISSTAAALILQRTCA